MADFTGDNRIVSHFYFEQTNYKTKEEGKDDDISKYKPKSINDVATELKLIIRRILLGLGKRARKRRRLLLEIEIEGRLGEVNSGCHKYHRRNHHNGSEEESSLSSEKMKEDERSNLDVEILMESVGYNKIFIDLTECCKFMLSAWETLNQKFSEDASLANMFQDMQRNLDSLLFHPTLGESSPSSFQSSLSSLTAHQSEWWNRPRWSWTYYELLLATGTILLIEISKEMKPYIQIINANSFLFQLRHLCVSSNKLLSKLPHCHLIDNNTFSQSQNNVKLPIISNIPTSIVVIDPKNDQAVIEDLLKTMKVSFLNDKFAGTLGKQLKETLGICFVSDLLQLPKCSISSMLLSSLGNNNKQKKSQLSKDIDLLFQMARGTCNEIVRDNQIHMNKFHGTKITNCHSTRQKNTRKCEQNTTTNNPHTIIHTPLSDKNKVKSKNGVVASNETGQNIPKPQYQSPRFDSNGFDLNVFEELPPTLRSELRMNVKQTRVLLGLDNAVETRKKKNKHMSPQIDSDGIDLTVLSQLPPNLRSEIRTSSIKRKQITSPKRIREKITRYTSPTITKWTVPHRK